VHPTSRGCAAPAAPPQPQAGAPHQAELVIFDQSIERAFAWLHARRLSKDYERLCATSEALVLAAMTRLMVRRLAR
jgi:transposase